MGMRQESDADPRIGVLGPAKSRMRRADIATTLGVARVSWEGWAGEVHSRGMTFGAEDGGGRGDPGGTPASPGGDGTTPGEPPPGCDAGGWAPAARPGPAPANPAPPGACLIPEPPAWPRLSVVPAAPEASLVVDAEGFRRVLAATERVPVVGIDTETTGLDPHTDRVRTIQFAMGDAAWVVDAWKVQNGAPLRDVAPVRQWLAIRARRGLRTVAHNAKFDLSMLRAALGGAPLAEVAVSDPMLWSQLLACGLPVEGGHGLSAVAQRWLEIELPKQERKGDWTGELRPEQVSYAARDAWALVPLTEAMWHGAGGRKGIAAEGLARVAALEDACVPAIADLEYVGFGFDLPYWTALTAEIREESLEVRAEALRGLDTGGIAGARRRDFFGQVASTLNLDSPPQVRAALRALGLDVASTAEGALKPFAADHPAVATLLNYKKLSKLLSAFGDALPRHVHPVTGRLHSRYMQLCGNGAGRFSCSSPNVQQVPHDPRFRRAFIPADDRRLVVADLSQIELRIMAKLSGDQRMLEAYRNGEDLHRLTASLVSGVPLDQVTRAQRQLSKAVNFGLCYSMSANGLRSYAQNAYGITMTSREADTFRRLYFEAYRGIAAFHRHQDREARRARETRTLLGRCRRWVDTRMGLPELVNSPDQGTGADILKRAMVLARPALLRADAMLVATIHDELVVECPADRAEEVRVAVHGALVAGGADLLDPVPVQAESRVGASWADKP